MRRTALLTLSAVAVVSLAVTACSNENEPKSKKNNKPAASGSAATSTTAAGALTGAAPVAPGSVDSAGLSAALSDWALNTAKAKYPDISPPIWSSADNAVLAYLPAGADAVQFCQALNDALTESEGTGFDSLDITVIQDMSNTEPLATSVAGAACS